MPENSSLRPEDIKVETFTELTPGFTIVDEDPTDPASGSSFDIFNENKGTWSHV